MTETNDPVGVEIALTSGTAISFAADALLDTYKIAKYRADTDTMLKVTNMWLQMSNLLDATLPVEEGPENGTGHYL